ncbi:hypothetical protein BH09ACT10_BH09ACT10_07640 [soil metagenome]
MTEFLHTQGRMAVTERWASTSGVDLAAAVRQHSGVTW